MGPGLEQGITRRAVSGKFGGVNGFGAEELAIVVVVHADHVLVLEQPVE
jgi:hypothetical protein